MKVLLATASKVWGKSIALGLSNEGYRVFLAQDGIQAEDIALDDQVDLIICDEGLTGISALTLVESIKTYPLFAEIPAILLTEHDEPKNWLHAQFSGFNAYLTKPFTPNSVLKVIEMVMNEQKLTEAC